MSAAKAIVYFAHGKESGPWGSKIKYLADVATAHGYAVASPDYSHTHNPKARVQQLLDLNPQAERLILAGSSMGGYVSAMACTALHPCALFLMAPAFYFDEYPDEPGDCPADTVVVHGWNDDVVPPERAIRFAQARYARLHLVDDGHRLEHSLDFLGDVFAAQLQRHTASTTHS